MLKNERNWYILENVMSFLVECVMSVCNEWEM